MAAATVGGAFLSAFLDVVFDRLASPEVANLVRGKKLDRKLLHRLETTLQVVRSVLDDAEKKQITHSNVKRWLDDLQEAVYDAEDLLDEVCTRAATQKEEKVSNLFSHLKTFNVNDREMGRVASELEDIVERLKSVSQLRNHLGLKDDIARENNLSYRTKSTSLEVGYQIYGRDKDKKAVMKLLTNDKGDGEGVSVISIVGMGGVGKTTLAQSIYNDDDLKQVFDYRAWVCVSEEFDIFRVTRTVTEAFTGEVCERNDLNLLQLYMQDKLKEKKFLIVLDDVWIEDYVNWNLLKKAFQHGIRGSKILITTRNDKVADAAQTDQAYHLNQLSDEDCWLVFTNHAYLSSESTENRVALEKIGKEIVSKCGGLPLAAKSLGGMLRRKHDIKDWKNILNSDIWHLSESAIIPALRVSYHYLPPHLKRCFVYCSLFPKDYNFAKKDLILLWMAEDLLSPTKKGKTLEEVGDEYFDDLASRSFFQCSSNWEEIEVFVMHDLMHDLATSLGGEFYLRLEKLGRETKISGKTRHFSFSKCNDSISENFEVFSRLKFLRTFLPVDFNEVSLDNELAAQILKNKTLRVLSFFESLKVLPNSIGELIHLRYLNLSCTQINTLPESLGNLHNLQTLLLSYCVKLTMLPDSIQNLVSLRNLDICFTHLKEMPKGMGKLNQLQGLDYFIVGKHEDNGIKELGNLSNLHGSLTIKKLEHITNSSQAMGARMMDKKHINRLSLQWSSTNSDCVDSQIEKDILCKLQPHQDLESLHINGYNGTRFPDWFGHSSYHNMKLLKLSSCSNCCMLPSLGQLPSLKTLKISRLNGLEKIDASFYKNDDSYSVKPFPSLKSLRFVEMPNWEVWTPFGSNAFPQLEHLAIIDCPKLKGDLPHHLPALKTLEIVDCKQIASSLASAPTVSQSENIESNKLPLQELPHSIKEITIKGSPTLADIMFEILANTQPTCLQSLTSSSKFLRVSIRPDMQLQRLEHAHHSEHAHGAFVVCDSISLISLPLDIFQNPKDLSISHCENLESLYVSGSHSLQNLTHLEIEACRNFVSFPREGLQAPNLTCLDISDCNKLKSLPRQMNALLPKLHSLWIFKCPEIEPFLEGSLPPDMREMNIGNCEKLLGGLAWPKEGLLPPSLTYLTLYEFSSLETLDCKGLLHLTCLQDLAIYDCPKLENMEGDRLPTSLRILEIQCCPLMQERCRTKIWPKISHIPTIYEIPE